MKKQDRSNLFLFHMFLFVCFFTNKISAQSFINGSFEDPLESCIQNISNAQFNDDMNGCFAFGTASQIDILDDTCGYGLAKQGSHFIAMAGASNGNADAFTLKLSSPIIAGNNYILSFYNRKSVLYYSNLLRLGYSNDSSNVGSYIAITAAIPDTVWQLESFSFSPAYDCNYISVKTSTGNFGWNLIDNFTITLATSIEENIQSSETIIFPNPTNDFITIKTNLPEVSVNTSIMNAEGKLLLRSNGKTIDLRKLNQGIYFVEVDLGSDRFYKKIIKN